MPAIPDLDALDEQFSTFHARFAHHFYRREYRERSAAYLLPRRAARLAWSFWRRRHQARAKHAHYLRRTGAGPPRVPI